MKATVQKIDINGHVAAWYVSVGKKILHLDNTSPHSDFKLLYRLGQKGLLPDRQSARIVVRSYNARFAQR